MALCGASTVSVFVLVVCFCFCAEVNGNRGYIVTCPSTLRSTTIESVSVTIFKPSEPVLVNVSLIRDGKEVLATQKEILGKGTITFTVPKLLRGEATLRVCGNCIPGNPKGFSFFNTTIVRIDEKGSSVFLQTDRPIYKPAQTVLIHAYIVDPDLRPTNVDMFAYVVDPRGSRMIQWDDVQPLCCGVVNLTFPISDQPVLGEWFVFVQVQGQLYNISFKVKEYVLPRFQIDVHPPKYIVGLDDCHSVIISASYVYGQPVRGRLIVTSNVHGIGYFRDHRGRPHEDSLNIDGTATVRICPSKYVNLYGDNFRGVLHVEAKVIASDGNTFTVVDESCPIYKKQLIGITFSKDTKQYFKPGLPYRGKILVTYPDSSPADSVTVRVKATMSPEVTSFNQDFMSKDGVVFFDIPVVEVATQMVWLDAIVTAIDGNPVKKDSYYSSYQSIISCYSPSKSHLLLSNQNDEETKVGSMAHIALMSTMPCNFTLNYDIIARGRIIRTGSHVFSQTSEDFTSEDSANSTKLNIKCQRQFEVEVTHDMSPSFTLVGYVVKDDREGVADTVTISVKHSLQNKVTVTSSLNETYPGTKLDLTISSTPGSCVCVASVDRSVHLLKPDYPLTMEKIFQELERYSIGQEDVFETFWFGSDGKRRRRSFWYDVWGRDAGFAFSEAGLHVMTDVVHLNFHQYVPVNGRGVELNSLNAQKLHQLPRRETRKRAYFPETWLWHCFNMSSTRKQQTFTVHVPDTITTWVTDVVSMSTQTGLGIARQSTIKTYKPFFVEYVLPYAVIRGEQVKIPITIYNYLDTCVQAVLTIGLSEGIHFVDRPGKRHERYRYCMEPTEIKTLKLPLIFEQLGNGNIHANVQAFRSPACCGVPSATTIPIAMDVLSKQVKIEAEGILRYYSHSVFFCPNERITISTPSTYGYKFVKKPSNLTVFVFSCKAKNDAHIALSGDATGVNIFEIVLGGWQNTKSWIASSKQGDHLVTAATPDILSWDEFKAFWVTFDEGLIQVGYGEIPNNSSLIMSWQAAYDINVVYIGFSTGWRSLGEFRIWRREDSENSYKEVFNLALPLNYIPGSEQAVATMIGDVMGPTLTNLHNLIRLPFGCGEQNMIHFAPNVYVMGYLQHTQQLTAETEKEAIKFLVEGYQRQLTYRHNDGSYSAFGERDSSGSMWLTAFVLKSFAQSRPFIYIDQFLLESSKHWIISQQLPDGSFPRTGRVLNKDIQGGVKGKVSLTAYVVIALLEAGRESVNETTFENAQTFLEDNLQLIDDPYTAALTAYALVGLQSQQATRAVRLLRSMAITQDGYTSWRVTGEQIETVARFGGFEDVKQTVNSAEVEMTAYGLLTYTALGDIASSLPIVKWLSKKRNALGGFTSTQDTCVALQALSQYATLAFVGGVNLNITLATEHFQLEESFVLNNQNNKVLQSVTIPQIPIMMFVTAEGEGCGLLQIDVKYNIPDPTTKQAFKLNIKMKDAKKMKNSLRKKRSADGQQTFEERRVEQDIVTIQACTRWLHPGSSNMAVLEISLHTGLTADMESLDELIYDRSTGVKRYEIDGRKVVFYFNEIPSQCQTCVNFTAFREYVVGNLKSVPARVYDYYEPSFEATRFYNVSKTSFITREPCEEDECNKVPEGSPALEQDQVSDDDCNTLSQNCDEDAHVSVCGCDRTCIETGTLVCGSDYVLYNSVCEMEVAACKFSSSVYAVPLSLCPEDAEIPKLDEVKYPSSTSRPTEIIKDLSISDSYDASGEEIVVESDTDWSGLGRPASSAIYELESVMVGSLEANYPDVEDIETMDEVLEVEGQPTVAMSPLVDEIWSTELIEMKTEYVFEMIEPTDSAMLIDISSMDETEIMDIETEETKVSQWLEYYSQSVPQPFDELQEFIPEEPALKTAEKPVMNTKIVEFQPLASEWSSINHSQNSDIMLELPEEAPIINTTKPQMEAKKMPHVPLSEIQNQEWNTSNSSVTEHDEVAVKTFIANHRDRPASDDPSRADDVNPVKTKHNNTKEDVQSNSNQRHQQRKEKEFAKKQEHHHVKHTQTSTPSSSKTNSDLRSSK